MARRQYAVRHRPPPTGLLPCPRAKRNREAFGQPFSWGGASVNEEVVACLSPQIRCHYGTAPSALLRLYGGRRQRQRSSGRLAIKMPTYLKRPQGVRLKQSLKRQRGYDRTMQSSGLDITCLVMSGRCLAARAKAAENPATQRRQEIKIKALTLDVFSSVR